MRPSSLATIVMLALALTLAPSSTQAVSVRSWAPASAEEFARGTFHGTALDPEGRLRLGPAFRNLWGPEPGVVWDVAVADDGHSVFAALSGPGRLVRLARSGESAAWFEASESVLVTAVAADRSGGAWFGLSPQGRVEHASAPGRVETVVETDAKFVWALTRDRAGNLWIGTGTPGRLLRLDGRGETRTIFETADDAIRSLVALPDGGVVAGTGDRGRVIRFDEEGRPFVLYDADEGEIVSLAIGGDGALLALAAGARGQRSSRATSSAAATPGDRVTVRAKAPDNGDGENDEPDESATPARSSAPAQRRTTRATGAGGSLYRIDADGGVRRIWSLDEGVPYSVVPVGDRALIATGGDGRLFSVDVEGRAAALMRFPSDEAVAMATGKSGAVFIGGAEDARVARIDAEPVAEGSFETEPLDADVIANWGAIRWEADVPPDASLTLEVRSGNTEKPDVTWSPWAAAPQEAAGRGALAPAPAARWFQARVRMTASSGGDSPVLRSLELFYLPRNRPPVIEELTVEPVGVAWKTMPVSSASRQGPLVADDPVAVRSAESLKPKARAPRIAKGYEVGARTFSWKGSDPDGDELTFSLEIRAEGEEHWFPLAESLADGFFSWDTRAMPDGAYRVRLVADDVPDNPNGRHLEATRTSGPFRVDNTRPFVDGFEVRRAGRGGGHEVRFVARDPGGRVDTVEYSLGGDGWHRLDPLDGVTDSEEEAYLLIVESGEAAHVTVRVTDAAGNLGGDTRRLDQ